MGPTGWFARLAGVPLIGLAGLLASSASAQNQGLVVRDGTLGSLPRGIVAPGPDDLGQADYLIRADLGEQHGGNLFHSFSRFSIGGGERATFTDQGAPDPGGIEHVISRVTGPESSQIDGTLHSTIESADVWLFNPQGVGFGAGARIDVRGTFHAASTDSVEFEDGSEPFRAEATSPAVLAVAKPSAFGFLPDGSRAALVVTGGLDLTRGAVELAGGDLTLTGAELEAPGAELGFEASGTVRFADQSVVNVGGVAPGTVSIRGGRLVVLQGGPIPGEERTLVLAENEGAGPGGAISVEAGEKVLVDNSLLSVSTHAAGNAGTIRLTAPDVTFQYGPGVDFGLPPMEQRVGARAETTRSGAGGIIEIDAGALTLAHGVSVSTSAVGSKAGDAGAVEISANSVELSDRSILSASGWGAPGKAGHITIDLGDSGSLRIDGTRPDGAVASRARVSTAGFGTPGTIDIKGRLVEVLNAGLIDNNCYGCPSKAEDRIGDEATIRIAADRIVVEGSPLTHTNAEVSASTYIGADGDAGRIILTGNTHPLALELLRGGSLLAQTAQRSGNGGEIDIEAGSILISGEAAYGSGLHVPSLDGWGHAGNIKVVSQTMELGVSAGISARSYAGGDPNRPGNAGRIDLDIGERLLIGSWVQADTLGLGGGGSITLRGGGVVIGPGGLVSAGSRGAGNAGTIKVLDADSLVIESGGQVDTSSVFGGDAGEVQVTARESIVLDHGESGAPFSLLGILGYLAFGIPSGDLTGIFSATIGAGDGGSIVLDAPEISVKNGAFVSTATVGGGHAGQVELAGAARHIRIENGAFVDSTSLPIDLPGIFLPGGAAGSVTLEAEESIEVVGRRPVTLDGAAYDEWSHVSSVALGSGAPGAVTLTAPRIVVDGGAVATTAVASQSARGSIAIHADDVLVANGGRIDASTFVADRGGGIDITATDSIVIAGGSGVSSRTGGKGSGGDLLLHAPRIEVMGGAEVSAESSAGVREVRDIFRSLFEEGFIPDVPTDANGDAGSIALEASHLVHLDGGHVTTSVGVAHGGNISIDPVFVVLQRGGSVTSEALEDTGFGGQIRIAAESFFQFPGSRVSAQGRNPALSGTVEIHSPDVNLAGTLAELPSTFLDASAQMRERCAARKSGERVGSFAVRGPGGIPAEPDGWLPAPMLPDKGAPRAVTAMPPVLVAAIPGSLLASGACP